MKHWEDILGKRLRGFRGKDVPGQADAIWDNIDTALGAPPSLSAPFWKRSAFQMALAIAAAVVIGLAVRQDLTPGSPSLTSGVERTTEGTEHPREDGLSASEDSPSKSSKTSAKAADLNDETATTSSETSTASSNSTAVPRETKSATDSTAEAPANGSPGKRANTASDIPSRTSASADDEVSKKEVKTKAASALALAMKSLGDAKMETGISPDFMDEKPLRKETTLGALRVLPLLGTGPLDAASATPILFGLNDVGFKRQTFAIRAYTGPTWSHFSDLNHPDQSDYFLTDMSAGGGLMLEFEGARPWSIGLAWNDYVHNLQYTETTQASISAPGVVSVTIDIQTGDTLTVTQGTVQGVEQRTRYVDHHNRFRAFSIPVEWRQVKSFNRLQFGVGLGATLQIRSSASGRVLNSEGLVVGYSDDNLSRGRMAVVPTARAFAGLRFAPAWRLDMGFAMGIQRHASRTNALLQPNDDLTWHGRLIHGQLQLGLSRFLSRTEARP